MSNPKIATDCIYKVYVVVKSDDGTEARIESEAVAIRVVASNPVIRSHVSRVLDSVFGDGGTNEGTNV